MENIYPLLCAHLTETRLESVNFRDVGHSSITRAHNIELPGIIFHIRDYLIPAAWNYHAEIRE